MFNGPRTVRKCDVKTIKIEVRQYLMDYKTKITELVNDIRKDVQTLGIFAFQGVGDIDELRECFVRSYEAAVSGLKIYEEAFPGQKLEAPVTLCGDDLDMAPMAAFYKRLKSEDFEPMPFDAQCYRQFSMVLNHIFIALQQAG